MPWFCSVRLIRREMAFARYLTKGLDRKEATRGHIAIRISTSRCGEMMWWPAIAACRFLMPSGHARAQWHLFTKGRSTGTGG